MSIWSAAKAGKSDTLVQQPSSQSLIREPISYFIILIIILYFKQFVSLCVECMRCLHAICDRRRLSCTHFHTKLNHFSYDNLIELDNIYFNNNRDLLYYHKYIQYSFHFEKNKDLGMVRRATFNGYWNLSKF